VLHFGRRESKRRDRTLGLFEEKESARKPETSNDRRRLNDDEK